MNKSGSGAESLFILHPSAPSLTVMPRKTILVVDDEKSQREILEMILSGEGYDVTTASSGEAAIKFAKDRRFDLALTDLKMTGMDGIELLQHLLGLDSSIIVILLTAHGSIESAKEALRRGAYCSAVVSK